MTFHSVMSKVTLGGSCIFSVVMITYVFWRFQYDERVRMRDGVYKDMKRQALKEENRKKLIEQKELEIRLRNEEDKLLQQKKINKQ